MSVQDKLGFDLIAIIILIATANPAVSGIMLHELAGGLLVLPLLLHGVLNWEWVAKNVGGFLGKLRIASRINVFIDSILFISAVGVTVSGVLVIPGFASSIGLHVSPLWHAIHLATADLTIAFLIVHISVHAGWLLNATRRTFRPAEEATDESSPLAVIPAVVPSPPQACSSTPNDSRPGEA